MGKRIGKKGLEHAKLVDFIIKVVLLLVIIGFILLFLIPKLYNFGEKGNEFFNVWKDINPFGDKVTGTKVVTQENPDTLLKSLDSIEDCDKKAKVLDRIEKIKDVESSKVIRAKLGVIECYLNLNKCAEAEKIADFKRKDDKDSALDSPGIKDQIVMKLIKCYAANSKDEDVARLKNELSTDEKRGEADKEIEVLKKLSEIREKYDSAIGMLSVEKYDDARKVLDEIQKLLEDSSLNTYRTNLNLIEIKTAVSFWNAYADIKSGRQLTGKCSLISWEKIGVGTPPNLDLRFPATSNKFGNSGKEIKLMTFFEEVLCYRDDGEKLSAETVWKLLDSYGSEEKYSENKKVVDEIIMQANLERFGNAKCEYIGNNPDNCEGFNKDLFYKGGKSLKRRESIDPRLYASLRCYFDDVPWSSNNNCGSCNNIKNCVDYPNRRPCEGDTCKVGDCDWDWKGPLARECVSKKSD